MIDTLRMDYAIVDLSFNIIQQRRSESPREAGQ
jgi:hypothetical protein